MDTLSKVRNILRDSLSLGHKADGFDASTSLLGALPEFDSMAVVTVVTMIEDEFGITVEDDELNAEVFATLGSLARFVEGKLSQ